MGAAILGVAARLAVAAATPLAFRRHKLRLLKGVVALQQALMERDEVFEHAKTGIAPALHDFREVIAKMFVNEAGHTCAARVFTNRARNIADPEVVLERRNSVEEVDGCGQPVPA